MVTSLVDPEDPIMGFTWNWIMKLAERLDRLYVATSRLLITRGLPRNIFFYQWSGKKQANKHRKGKTSSIKRILSYVYVGFKVGVLAAKLKLRRKIDVVFAHMNPEFVLVLAPLCKLLRLPIALWYLHKKTSLRLVLAYALSDIVITAHQQGFPINGSKVKAIGHGIELKSLPPKIRGENVVLCVGRISRVKRYEEVIKAISRLLRKGLNVKLVIAGPVYDEDYYRKLLELIQSLSLQGKVRFIGPIPHSKIASLYSSASVLVSCCPAFDKAVLEAMSMGLPVIVGDKLFDEVLGKYRDICRYKLGFPESLANKLEVLLESKELREKVGRELRLKVLEEHSVNSLTERLVDVLESLAKPSTKILH